jgi:hypothetical protein
MQRSLHKCGEACARRPAAMPSPKEIAALCTLFKKS